MSVEEGRLALAPEYRLYDESQGIVLFSRDPSSAHERYIVPPDVGFILALCDGTRSIDEISDVVAYVYSVERMEAAVHVRSVLEHFRDLVLVPASEVDTRWKRLSPQYDSLRDFMYETDGDARFRARRPYCLVYIATRNCLRDCVYCYADAAGMGRHQAEAALPFHRLEELLAEAGRLGVGVINLTGGEPFVRNDMEDIILLALENGVFPWISTKALVGKRTATQFGKAGLPVIQVSIDSWDQATQEALCRSDGAYKDIRTTLANLLSNDISVYTNTVVTAINIDHIPELVSALADLGVASCQLTPYARSLGRHSDSLFATEEQWKCLLKWYADADPERVQLRFARGLDTPASAERDEREASQGLPRSTCTAGKEGFVFLPDGQVTVCERLSAYVDHMPDVLVGDVAHSGIAEVWDSPRLVGLAYPEQELYSGTTCRTCTDFTSCSSRGGRCYVRALAVYGRLFAPDPLCPSAPPFEGRLL